MVQWLGHEARTWEHWVVHALPLMPCVTLGKSVTLCASVLHLYNGDNSIALLPRGGGRINP